MQVTTRRNHDRGQVSDEGVRGNFFSTTGQSVGIIEAVWGVTGPCRAFLGGMPGPLVIVVVVAQQSGSLSGF